VRELSRRKRGRFGNPDISFTLRVERPREFVPALRRNQIRRKELNTCSSIKFCGATGQKAEPKELAQQISTAGNDGFAWQAISSSRLAERW
jgi:hypothetical protein